MPASKVDISVGDVFSHWTVLDSAEPYVTPRNVRVKRWVLRCECGTIATRNKNQLVSGQSRHCGCKIPTRTVEVGKTYKRLRVLAGPFVRGKYVKFKVRCEAGHEFEQYGFALSGRAKSGCRECGKKSPILREKTRRTGLANKTHGMTGSPEYKVWSGIKNRCFREHDPAYYNYGGRGVTMAPEWVNDFPSFLAHVGKRPSKYHSLDRLDNDGNYEPGNVAWRTMEEQNCNRRNTRFVTYQGEEMPFSVFCRKVNGNYTKLYRRIFRLGWGVEDAIHVDDGRVGV